MLIGVLTSSDWWDFICTRYILISRRGFFFHGKQLMYIRITYPLILYTKFIV